jgi:carbamoyl-phosphate synthase large subunit
VGKAVGEREFQQWRESDPIPLEAGHPMSKKKMWTVLLTGAGGAGTLEIINSLKKQAVFRTVGLDASAYSRGLGLCDAGYVIPFATDPRFRTALTEIISKERPDFAIPLVDEEILPFHDLVAELGPRAPKLIAPNRIFCEITLDKWKTFQNLTKVGLPTPKTALASDAAKISFPAVIKPRDGRGSRELAYLRNAADLEAFLKTRSWPADNYIVQRQVFGTEYTVSVVVGLDGTLLAVVPKEVVVKKGITQVGVTRNHEAIENLCRDVQLKLRADGPFNVQLMLQPDGTSSIIEINPRYSTTVALTLASGIDEVGLVIRHAMGEKVEPRRFQPDLLMFRYQTQIFMPEKEWPAANVAGGERS